MNSRILLVDVDSTIPNIALGKLSTHHKSKGDIVDFMQLHVPYYPTKNHTHIDINTAGYDRVYCSAVFNGSMEYVHGENMIVGGTGYDIKKKLLTDIEMLDVDYSLYPDNDTSYGFITRGCIRKCSFCVVPDKEGYIHQVSTVDRIVQHKKVKFLDNNILAFPGHYDIFVELIHKNIKCQFNQGLDIRLVDRDNSDLLRQINYIGEYIFAFDDWSYLPLIEKGMSLLSWATHWKLKFFVYVDPRMEVSNIINRIEWIRKHKQLPYIMRNISCWESEHNEFYVDIAAWCNQPGLFKRLTFSDFLYKRHPKNGDRVEKHIAMYKEAL